MTRLRPLTPGTITVELHDGQTFVYATQTPPADVIADLERHGVRRQDIRRTVHVIPRGHVGIVGGAARQLQKDGDA